MRIWTVPVPEFLGGPFHDAGNGKSFDSGKELASESRPSAQDDKVERLSVPCRCVSMATVCFATHRLLTASLP